MSRSAPGTTGSPARMCTGDAALALVVGALAAFVGFTLLHFGRFPPEREAPFHYGSINFIFLALLPLHLLPFAIFGARYAAVRRWHAVVWSAVVGAAGLLMLYVVPVIDSTWHVVRAAGMVVLATAAGYELLWRVEHARSRLAPRGCSRGSADKSAEVLLSRKAPRKQGL